MTNKSTLLMAACAVTLASCSSAPRNFAPVTSSAPADRAAFDAHWLNCREQVARFTNKGSGRLASAGAAAAAGAGAGLAAGAATSGATFASYGAAAAAGAAVIAVVPVVGLVGAWGVSKIKKTKKERMIKAATSECMIRNSFAVDNWRVMSRREVRAVDAKGRQNSDQAVVAALTEPQ